MSNHQLLCNLDYNSLKDEMETKENVYLPLADSPLLKNQPQFYVSVLKKTVTLVPVKKTVDDLNISFDVDIPVSPQTLCMICIDIYRKSTLNFDSFAKVAGFDMKHLPDSTYLLKLIATMDSQNPIIQKLPAKGLGLSKEWTNIVGRNALANIIKTKKVQDGHKISLDGLEDYVAQMSDSAKTYYLCKFKLSDVTKKLTAISKMAKSNPLISDIVKAYKPSKKIGEAQAKLVTAENIYYIK